MEVDLAQVLQGDPRPAPGLEGALEGLAGVFPQSLLGLPARCRGRDGADQAEQRREDPGSTS